jgi:hypothetical protein
MHLHNLHGITEIAPVKEDYGILLDCLIIYLSVDLV